LLNASDPCLPNQLNSVCSIAKTEAELKALGGDISYGRGSMLHLILTLCHKLEKAYTKIVDGGRDGE
jgi:dynamin 1-like protein